MALPDALLDAALDVEIDRDKAQPYRVVELRSRKHVRAYDNLCAAWDHAVWAEHAKANRLPECGPGGWYHSALTVRAWTSDPRYAKTIPLEDATPEQIRQSRDAAVRFIRAHLDANPLEVFMPEHDVISEHHPGDYETDLIGLSDDDTHDLAEQAALEAEDYDDQYDDVEPPEDHDDNPSENPEDAASEPLSVPEGGWTIDSAEALREALSDSARNAYDNFRHMAENAPTESARAFWTGEAEAVLRGDDE